MALQYAETLSPSDDTPSLYIRFANAEQRRMFLEEILPEFAHKTEPMIQIDIKELKRDE